jgi:hypothetical protein
LAIDILFLLNMPFSCKERISVSTRHWPKIRRFIAKGNALGICTSQYNVHCLMAQQTSGLNPNKNPRNMILNFFHMQRMRTASPNDAGFIVSVNILANEYICIFHSSLITLSLFLLAISVFPISPFLHFHFHLHSHLHLPCHLHLPRLLHFAGNEINFKRGSSPNNWPIPPVVKTKREPA